MLSKRALLLAWRHGLSPSTASALGASVRSMAVASKPGSTGFGGSDRSKPKAGRSEGLKWTWLQKQGAVVNPCNSALHPAVAAGLQPRGDARSVQEAYNPSSQCFGCGHSNSDGLQLQSFRIPGGLQATVRLPARYKAFPGIINGGIVSTVFDCHGNWTAAIALMDQASTTRPPLTLTYELLVSYKQPTPPDEDLHVRSQVVNITEPSQAGSSKTTVQVDLSLYAARSDGGPEKLLATATGLFRKTGALRSV